jgi:two-component system, cell cycle response regulator
MSPEEVTTDHHGEARTDANDTPLNLELDASWRCRVLIVDDDELMATTLASLLVHADYDVHIARSGEEALRIMSATPCKIVVTDWQMPNMDGLALCRSLRSRGNSAYVYVLLHTVRHSKPDVLAGLTAGADDYIVKGAPSEEIIARLEVGRRITRLEHSLRVSNREHRRLSVTDSLTGLRNRRYLMKYLPRELERSRRHNRPLSILSCDIDNFKRINDEFGHETGDEVLQAIAGRLTTCIRESTDWIARMGGEEFMIVLPETNLSGASRVAEKVRSALAGQPIATRASILAVTVSIGATALETMVDLETVSIMDLLRAADRCLYVSKHLGRDRTTVAPVASPRVAPSAAPSGARNEIN